MGKYLHHHAGNIYVTITIDSDSVYMGGIMAQIGHFEWDTNMVGIS